MSPPASRIWVAMSASARQRLDVAAPGRGHHRGQAGGGVFRVRRGIEVGQGFRILQPAQDRLRNNAIFLVQILQNTDVALTAQNAPDGGHQPVPAVFLRELQHLFQLRQQITVVTGLYHCMHQSGVGRQNLLVFVGQGGHREFLPGFDGSGKYTTLAPLE